MRLPQAIGLLAVLGVLAGVAFGELRGVGVGDLVEGVCLERVEGGRWCLEPGGGRRVLVSYVMAGQVNSQRVIKETARVLAEAEGVEWVAALMGEEAPGGLSEAGAVVVRDTERVLWGRLGVMAAPTVVLIDEQGRIAWAHSGFSYGYGAGLAKALSGDGGEKEAERPAAVEGLENSSDEARMVRHLRMAEMLCERGQREAALGELRKGYELRPGSVRAAVELGTMLCEESEPNEALRVIERFEGERREAAGAVYGSRVRLVRGWAYRQQGRLGAAREELEAAVALDPRQARGHYELGRVAEELGEQEAAAGAYRRAAELLMAAH